MNDKDKQFLYKMLLSQNEVHVSPGGYICACVVYVIHASRAVLHMGNSTDGNKVMILNTKLCVQTASVFEGNDALEDILYCS